MNIYLKSVLFAILCVLCGASCTLSMSFNQCTQDQECPRDQPFCTSDHICVPNTPIERLCTQTFPTDISGLKNPIHVGVMMQLTGTPAGQVGDALRLNSVKIAVNEINDLVAASGGFSIILHLCDAALPKADLINSMNLLAQQKNAVAVIGPTQNQTMKDLASVAANLRLPLVSPTVTTPDIRDFPNKGYTFTLAPLDVQQAQALFKVLVSQLMIGANPSALSGLKLVGIYTQDPYGGSVQQAFQKALSDNVANKSLDNPFSYPEGKPDRITEAEDNVKRLNGIAAVLLITHEDAATFLTDFNEPTSPYYLDPSIKIICADGCRTDALLNAASASLREGFSRVSGVSPVALTSANEAVEFQRAYQRAYKDPSLRLTLDRSAAYAYDAVYAIGIAAQSIDGAPTGATVAQALARFKKTLTAQAYPVGRSFYSTAANQLKNANVVLTGVTGPVSFLDSGERDSPQYEGWNVQVAAQNPGIVIGSTSCGGKCNVACAAGYTNCSDQCRDLTSDLKHCGACGNACKATESCCNGACMAGSCMCTAGQTSCGLACVDTQSDPTNCGACGAACPIPTNSTVSCVKGKCAFDCNPGFSNCSGVCRNTFTDAANCGACSTLTNPTACSAGQSCCNGVCVTGNCSCPAGQSLCGAACVNLQTDANNCGTCGKACTGGQLCCGGACMAGPCPCAAGLTSCSGVCKNLLNDSSNCNQCGKACTGGQTCCNGACVTGACTCPAGQTNCSGVCKDTQRDANACGSCNTVCPVPQNGSAFCAGGTCNVTCNANYTACGSACKATNTDLSNCGSCGNVCATPALAIPASYLSYPITQ